MFPVADLQTEWFTEAERYGVKRCSCGSDSKRCVLCGVMEVSYRRVSRPCHSDAIVTCVGPPYLTSCLCSQCEALISRHERSQSGRSFDVVHRLRADLLFEAEIALPPLRSNAVFVPFMNGGGGVNDQVLLHGIKTDFTLRTQSLL